MGSFRKKIAFLLFVYFCCWENVPEAFNIKSFAMADSNKLVAVEFEIFGKVQGVFFRKNTVIQGKKLGLRGWCMNTSRDTVVGVMEGEPAKVDEMKHWLRYVGSKNSKITNAEFRHQKFIPKFSFSDFSVQRD